MIAVTIVLRLLHILGGVLWVGTALLNTFFLAPSVAATGEAGQKFMSHLVGRARLSARVTLASYITILSGAVLYWIDSQGFDRLWMSSGFGMGLGLGALAGFVGFGYGQIVGKNASRIAGIAAEISGAPSAKQAEALTESRNAMTRAGRISTAFLILSLALMATARYWLF